MVMSTAIIATQSRSGALMLGLSLLAFAFVLVRRQGSRAGKGIVLAAAVVAIVAAANLGGIGGVLNRLSKVTVEDPGERSAIWQSASRQIRDFPLTGTGLNTFGVASIHYQDPARLARTIEAHNDYLQLAAEGGLLLGIPALAAIISFIVAVRRRFKERTDDLRIHWLRTGAVMGLVAMAGQSVGEFTLQMPGAAVMFVLLAAIAMHRSGR
jgi:O-antigen ligase